ncbi:MAG: metal-sensing transcriptional repressor [Clostridia bacterium]|nr:metal-sensing transcriptional repressor [Clostridia bacterium]
MDEKTCCACVRKKERSDEEKRALINRLNRIEGQIRGIRAMVEKDAYCPDILTQASAASAAINGFAKVLLGEHIRTCVAEDVRQGNDDTLDELLGTLQKWMK